MISNTGLKPGLGILFYLLNDSTQFKSSNKQERCNMILYHKALTTLVHTIYESSSLNDFSSYLV